MLCVWSGSTLMAVKYRASVVARFASLSAMSLSLFLRTSNATEWAHSMAPCSKQLFSALLLSPST